MKERATKAKGIVRVGEGQGSEKGGPAGVCGLHRAIFDEFMELHGDRQFRDDPAIVGGVAYLDGQPVTVIGVHKGKDMNTGIRNTVAGGISSSG